MFRDEIGTFKSSEIFEPLHYLMSRRLPRIFHTFIAAYTIEEKKSYYIQIHDQFVLVVLDVFMGFLDSYEKT